MIRRIFALIAVSLVLASCGVKTDLWKPDNQKTKSGEQDPSKPPHPLGR